MRSKAWIVLTLGILILAGCSTEQYPLTETHEFEGFGFTIDYPEGWYAITDGPVTWIAETEADYELRWEEKYKEHIGIVVGFDHRSLTFLSALGLPEEDPTLNDLFQLNLEELTTLTNPTIEETTVFGVDALKAKYYGEIWEVSYAGYIGDEAFYLWVAAPTEEMLEGFLPTWERMLDSIRPVAE